MKAQQLFNVEGLSVVVTGAASGIGLAYAEVMAENGARVTLIDQNADALEIAIADLRTTGADVAGAVADVTKQDSLQSAFDSALKRQGRLDVVFANAGISSGPGFLDGKGQRNPAAAIENLSMEMWDRVIATNLTSVFRTLQIAVPPMKKQGGGRIIVTSSISVTHTESHVGSIYVTSKAGVGQLVRQAAYELARYNILVNAIAPGPVITNIGGGRLNDPAARAPFEKINPMHRLAVPQDVKGAALYLASPASSYVTGAQIVIDGGTTLGSTAD